MILSPIEQSIKRKIESAGVPLKDWDINIYRGVLTGYNDAFIISGAKRDEILAECNTEEERRRTDELIRPVLRGRDIKRYGYEFADLWLINTHNGIKEKGIPRIDVEKDYPAVKKHLDEYWDKIEKRADQGDTPYNLRNCAYLDDFFKPKIVWSRLMRLSKNDINNFPRFCFTSGDYFVVDSLCFFSGSNVEVLVNELNSEFAAWYFFNNVAVLDNGGFQMRQQYVENIPLPKLTKGVTKKTVDEKIYEAFGFSSKEIDFIREAIKHKQQEVLNIIK